MDFERELEQRLADLPLPDGLLERLRAVASEGALTDEEIAKWLGQVALPEGLVARLRAIARDEAPLVSITDVELDKRLRDASVPAGFMDGLRAIAQEEAPLVSITDVELDEQLRGVPVPAGFIDGLQAIARDEAPLISITDIELDEGLRGVPLPAGFIDGLRAIAEADELLDPEMDEWLRRTPEPAGLTDGVRAAVEEEALRELLVATPSPPERMPAQLRTLPFVKRKSPLVRWAVAASLIFVLFGAQWTGIGAMLASLRRQPDEVELLVVDQGPLQLTSPWSDVVLVSSRDDEDLPAPTQEPLEALSWFEGFDEPQAGPMGQLAHEMENNRNFYADVFLLKWDFLGAPSSGDDQIPEMMTVSLPAPRGIEPPLVRGYDRKFLLREKSSPLISPAAHPELRTAKAPLTTSTDSYVLTRKAAESNRFPAERDVRVEDYLAAMPYNFKPPSNRALDLVAAAGPSRFSNKGAGMLQLGVQAAAMPKRRPVQLTIALDMSASMRWDAQLDHTRLAVARLLRHLTNQDRVTIVAFNDEPLTLVDQASREQLGEIKRMLSHLRPRGGTNLALGLQHAAAEALREQDGQREKMLLVITDAGDALDDATLTKLESLLGQATSRGLRLSIFDWNRDESASMMEGCMVRCGGEYHRLAEAKSLGWRMVDALSQRSSLVARNARLRVEFNPKAVAFYRLLGHDTNALAGLTPFEPRADLRALDSSTALFEVMLKPGGERRVGVAILEWNDAKTGKPRSLRRVLQRDLFVSTFAGSPPELQAATLAAEAAEIVGRNYFGQNQTRNLREVLRAMESVHPDLEQRAEYAEFVELLRKLEEIRTRRGTR